MFTVYCEIIWKRGLFTLTQNVIYFTPRVFKVALMMIELSGIIIFLGGTNCGSKTITVDFINPFVFFRRLAQITPVESIFE